MHQTGSGVVLPVWAACFGGQWRNESGESWKYCGDSVLKAGLGQLYPFGHANFTDPKNSKKFRHSPKNSKKFKGLYKGLVLNAKQLVE